MSKQTKTKRKKRGNDLFISTLLVCCAFGKVHWLWFWLLFVLLMIVEMNGKHGSWTGDTKDA